MNSRITFSLVILLFEFSFTLAVFVNLTDGPIRGYAIRSGDVETNVFKGIPFARPPLGDLRFRPSHPPDKWTQVRDTIRYARPCMSNSSVTTTVQNNTSEDCLYLNVWADARCSANSLCPVVYLIHGGAFQGDSAIMFNETHLIDSFASDRLVFVIPAYRLGIFGFLDLGVEIVDAPYNVAIYDMIAALEWTKRELPKFGGDVNQITIFGYSSSAVAVEYLLSSPSVDGSLFSRAVMSSGCPKLHQHFSRSMTEAVVDVVGCNRTTDLQHQLSCLRSKPAKLLADSSRLTYPSGWTNVGAQSDSILFSSPSFVGLRPNWKPKPIILISTRKEMYELEERPLAHVCVHYLSSLGYFESETLDECIRHYSAIDHWEHEIYRDLQHTMNVLIAQWNTRKGASSFVGLFGMKNHDSHTGDLFYLLGFHRDRFNFTADDKWMEEFYVGAVKRFIKGGMPTDDWLLADLDGRGFLYVDYESASSNRTEVRPLFHPGELFNRPAVDFWLHDLAAIDAHYSSLQLRTKQSSYYTESMESPEFVSVRREARDSLTALSSWSPNGKPLSHSSLFDRVWHPLHNPFLVILAICVLICVLSVVVMTFDVSRIGAFKRSRVSSHWTRTETGIETMDVDENSSLLKPQRTQDYDLL